MPVVPASCSRCGLVFGATNIWGGGGTVRFIGCTTNCPRCGFQADILDGVYKSLGDAVQVLSMPQRSAATLRALADTLKNAKLQNSSAEEIKAAIIKQSPELTDFHFFFPTKEKRAVPLYHDANHGDYPDPENRRP
jgi:hypothetical protein